MNYEQTIYNTARAGTPDNPEGVPSLVAQLLVLQSKHETANYTSNFFKKYNNAFGYSYAKGSKWQSSAGTNADNNQPIAVYDSIENSTREVVDWLYRRVKEGKFPPLQNITNTEQYASLLKNSAYYQDSLNNYLNGLNKYYNDLKDLVEDNASGIGVLLLILGAGYLILR